MRVVLSVASARPNFVKLAAVHHALANYKSDFRHIIVHTGQHYDPLLSDIFFEQLNIPQPSENLGIHGGTREEVIQATDSAITPVLEKYKPDIVLVYGDVNGAVGAAMAAKRLGIPLGHVEAGLRSFDTSMPEEVNRVQIDQIADVLFCSEKSGMKHLEEEGVPGKRYLVGNTMIDTLKRMEPTIGALPLPFTDAGQTYAISTLHRPSNVDDPKTLAYILDFLSAVAKHVPVLLPVHPRLQNLLTQSGKNLSDDNIFTMSPLGYLHFIRQMRDAAFILTDSGGIQEEAVLLSKRCFTLRRNTERPSTIESGSNVLIDPENEQDRQTVLAFAEHPKDPAVTVPEMWDGKTGERIAEILKNL